MVHVVRCRVAMLMAIIAFSDCADAPACCYAATLCFSRCRAAFAQNVGLRAMPPACVSSAALSAKHYVRRRAYAQEPCSRCCARYAHCSLNAVPFYTERGTEALLSPVLAARMSAAACAPPTQRHASSAPRLRAVIRYDRHSASRPQRCRCRRSRRIYGTSR